MFLVASVIVFREGGFLYDVTSCLADRSHVPCGEGGLCLWSHVPSRGSLFRGDLCQGDPPEQRPPRMVTSGRYASYWNAFLLSSYFCTDCIF